MGYEEEKAWSDKFMPQVKRYVGHLFIEIASLEDDRHHNTDLIVRAVPGRERISVRVRRFKNYQTGRGQFTIRSRARGGGETEYDKLLQGKGDYMFYGIAGPDDETIIFYMIIDLKRLRENIINHDLKTYEKVNVDGYTAYRTFYIDELVPGVITEIVDYGIADCALYLRSDQLAALRDILRGCRDIDVALNTNLLSAIGYYEKEGESLFALRSVPAIRKIRRE